MREDLQQIIRLQELDLEIRRLETAAKAVPAAIAEAEARLGDIRGELDRAREALAALEKTRRAKESELKTVEQQGKDKQGRLWEIKKNEEYTAVLQEIEVLKAKRSAFEEEILLLFDQIEEAQAALTKQEEILRTHEAAFREERERQQAELKRVEAELGMLRERRKRGAQGADPTLLQTYARLLRSRGGVAVVPVRDGSCGGCFVALTPQTHAEVKKGEAIITCANCSRLLYWVG
ncbi:MAG: zinc ribbon domain-containing protein [Candidatus Methylomirabilales bacterium]